MVKYENEVFYLTKDFLSTLMSLKTEQVLLPKNTTPSDLSRLNSKYSNINGTPLNKMKLTNKVSMIFKINIICD